jgi:hypothetical protein
MEDVMRTITKETFRNKEGKTQGTRVTKDYSDGSGRSVDRDSGGRITREKKWPKPKR